METETAASRSEPLTILVGRQSDGCTYQLDPQSRRRLAAHAPEAFRAPLVFVGYETQADFERAHGPLWSQIAQLLSGLSEMALRAMGGFTLYDPERETTVYEDKAA